MPNKYHEALNLALDLIRKDIDRYDNPECVAVNYRYDCMDRLRDLQKALDKIAQLKQSLKELDLEGK